MKAALIIIDPRICISVNLKHIKESSLVENRAHVSHQIASSNLRFCGLSFFFLIKTLASYKELITLAAPHPVFLLDFVSHPKSPMLVPIRSLRLWYVFFLILFLSSQITHACTGIPWVLCDPVMFVLNTLCSC